MRLLKRISLITFPILLSACASLQEPSVNPPENATPALRLDASGEQIFRCVHDMKGWFWRFETPNAYLFNPATGQAVAKHGYRFSFVHNDGSKIASSRITSIKPGDGKNLADALFQVTSPANHGTFVGIRYIQRLNAKGGIPQVKCTPAREGKLNRVPFEAEFVFWR
ncbi:MAG TPA: DUF3455 domain-containing protein [Candidatus Aphodousia faecigallinarum]|uniref:DUF3455 domain-containing protein n=1 Tax=Candidatus Aphodousia faecigallinarum TaxID=2840677 RepID=A0A9D1IHS9_9BURK|nr:DUF3455 domain-containing protein [Candidatus Aphodousia faecigallinarum]